MPWLHFFVQWLLRLVSSFWLLLCPHLVTVFPLSHDSHVWGIQVQSSWCPRAWNLRQWRFWCHPLRHCVRSRFLSPTLDLTWAGVYNTAWFQPRIVHRMGLVVKISPLLCKLGDSQPSQQYCSKLHDIHGTSKNLSRRWRLVKLGVPSIL